jgi:transposase
VLKSIALRYQHLDAEIDALDQHFDQLVAAAAPALVAIKGVGTDIASTLLTIAGDNPDRLNSEGAFAHLIGVAPIEASSVKITRYRLNRGGDRQGNRALYLLAVGRMGRDPATKAYLQRRTAEGRTKPEIIRCLKRYIARELDPVLLAATSTLVLAAAPSRVSETA